MNIALWIAAGVLSAVALTGGITKVAVPQRKLVTLPSAAWTGRVDAATIKGLGVLELLAAAGLTLPLLLDIAPVMVAVTAVFWALLMVGAAIVHFRNGEMMAIAANVVYLAVSVFVALGRF
ncbi:DoxX family protein [Nocardia sp. NPDC059691]|uniref:DoxX family protein n=1 Tax=Nocardia sp. NPDC059691 TaxID=3346908 RepID=UPI0036A718B6